MLPSIPPVFQPTAPYFEKCISEQDLDEVHIEIIRNTLYKVGTYVVTVCCSHTPSSMPKLNCLFYYISILRTLAVLC